MQKKILLMAAVIFSSYLHAQKDSTGKTLDEVIITATKTPIKQSQTGKAVIVIGQAYLMRNAGKTLTEILNYQAGIFVNGANNPLGTNQDIYFRGAATGNTLILMDGVPVGDPSQINNSFDLNNINPSQVERIEILKGAQSTLWGSDAVAGVINIITKKGTDTKISPSTLLSYGSYNSFKANAGLRGKAGGFTYNLTYNYTNSDGFSSAHDSTNRAAFDKDGFEQNNFQANLAYKVTKNFTISALSNNGKYNAEIDNGAFNDDKDYAIKNTSVIHSIGLVYNFSRGSLHLTNTLIHAKRISVNDTTANSKNGDYYHGNFKGKSLVSELYGNINLSGKLSLTGGIQRIGQKTDQANEGYSRDYAYGYSSLLSDDSAKTNTYAVYASMLLNQGNFNAEAGMRYTDHSIYGDNTTFTFNPSYNVDEDTKVFVNISSGFKVPSIYQLYSEYGNKNLEPEKSHSYELGVQSLSNNRQNSVRLVAFKRDIKDLLIFYSDPVTYASQYINRDVQHDYGFELESNLAIAKLGNWINNFTYVDGEGNDNEVKVKNLYRRPNFTFNSVLTLEPVKGLTLMPSFRFVGTRLKGQYDAGPALMPQYYTLDFYAGYQFIKQLRVFADFRNLTNQTYFDVPGYNSRRSNYTFGINGNF